MTKDSTEVSMSLTLRQATPDMLEALYQVDVAAWGEEMAATREMLVTRMRVNPGGNWIAVHEASGRIAGSVWTVWTDDVSHPTWFQSTGEGIYEKVFNPEGEVLFGVNISVDRTVPAQDPVGPFLLHAATMLVHTHGRTFARMGGRMAGYHAWQKLFRPDDYIHLYRQPGGQVLVHDPAHGFYHDLGPLPELMRIRDSVPEWIEPYASPIADDVRLSELVPFDYDIAFFASVPVLGRRFRIKRLLPGYFPDPESCDNGVLFEWRNPERA